MKKLVALPILVALLASPFCIINVATYANAASSPDLGDWPMFRHDPAHTSSSYSAAPSTNQTLWGFKIGDAVGSSPAVADGKVFVGAVDSKLYCLNAATGTLKWAFTTGGAVDSSPAVDDGRVYFLAQIHYLITQAQTTAKYTV